jgi:hypothetical protein
MPISASVEHGEVSFVHPLNITQSDKPKALAALGVRLKSRERQLPNQAWPRHVPGSDVA